jgi:anti-anti-sigma factor
MSRAAGNPLLKIPGAFASSKNRCYTAARNPTLRQASARRVETHMELLIERLDGDVTRLAPVGRWDIKGADAIGLRFSAMTGAGRRVIVDLGKVEYLSSMGLRSLIMAAKSTGTQGGKLVLLAPNALVAEVLKTAQLHPLIPTFDDFAAAQSAASA